ncbi:MAG: RsmB/NOP family class I SAM-dependent RNA methyltransferase [Myxococcota bacterium]
MTDTPLWSIALPRPPVPSPKLLRALAPLLAAMHARPSHAGPIVAQGLREIRAFGSKERPVAGDLLLGLIRHERALARIDPDPLTAWLRLAAEGPPDLPDPEPDPAKAYAVALSVPDALAAEWWERLGPQAAIDLARRLAGRAPVTLRVLREPVDLPVPHRRVGAHGLVLDGRANVQLLDAWREGRVEVMDLGSQAIVDFVAPTPGLRVLDLCAGAGGKSLALAALGADVQAWDVRPAALVELRKRAARANLAIRVGPPPSPGKGRYDLVLVDAPCSGTGVLRRHPENRWKLRYPTDIQAQLLADARRLADRVVYATCALTRAENEALVRSVLGGEPLREATVWPDEDREGFYMAEVGGT